VPAHKSDVITDLTGVRNIKLVLAYDGTAYAGWQRQLVSPTIQQTIEDKIAVMTGTSVVLHGAGRTDAGVHALAMVANFYTEADVPELGFQRGLNSLLPQDIRVLSATEVAHEFHARYRAVGKSYRYALTIADTLLPTERLYSAHIFGPFDTGAVQECLESLVGVHDFSSFETAGSRDLLDAGRRGAVREISAAVMRQVPGDSCRYHIEIAGDGFLRHMVRNIVGTLIEVGRGKRSVAGFMAVLAARDRAAAGKTAPARGLFLQEVFYK